MSKNISVKPEQLGELGTIFAALNLSLVFGVDAPTERGVMAGIVTTLHTLLPATEFKNVMQAWEVDAIQLTELLELGASATPGNQSKTFTDV